MVPIKGPNLDGIYILVGPPVMYKAVQLFSEALKTELTIIPFSKHLVLCGGDLSDISVSVRLLLLFVGPLAFAPGRVRSST